MTVVAVRSMKFFIPATTQPIRAGACALRVRVLSGDD